MLGTSSWDILEMYRGLRGQELAFCLLVCFSVVLEFPLPPPQRSVVLCFNCPSFLLATGSTLWPYELSQSNILLDRTVSIEYVIGVGCFLGIFLNCSCQRSACLSLIG